MIPDVPGRKDGERILIATVERLPAATPGWYFRRLDASSGRGLYYFEYA
jgi:hypothetical protein